MKIGPKYKICRRLGEKVFSKCQTTKFAISGSATGGNKGGGRGGGGRPKSLSDYGRQLLEKQKARYAYGVGERQFANYVKQSRRQAGPGGPTESLYQSMESRLDNVVYRAGFAISRAFARQMVSHGHISVDSRRVNVPSYQVRPGEVVAIKEASRGKGLYRDLTERLKEYKLPEWLTAEGEAAVLVSRRPTKTAEFNLDFGPIIEFYSRV